MGAGLHSNAVGLEVPNVLLQDIGHTTKPYLTLCCNERMRLRSAIATLCASTEWATSEWLRETLPHKQQYRSAMCESTFVKTLSVADLLCKPHIRLLVSLSISAYQPIMSFFITVYLPLRLPLWSLHQFLCFSAVLSGFVPLADGQYSGIKDKYGMTSHRVWVCICICATHAINSPSNSVSASRQSSEQHMQRSTNPEQKSLFRKNFQSVSVSTTNWW